MIRAKIRKKWYTWIAQDDATWLCFVSDWRGYPVDNVKGLGMTRREAYADLQASLTLPQPSAVPVAR